MYSNFSSPLIFRHLGSGNSVRILEEAQKEGLPITAETCHHYLNLNSDEIPDAAAEFKCCPPVRDGWHREKLWDAVKKVDIFCNFKMILDF